MAFRKRIYSFMCLPACLPAQARQRCPAQIIGAGVTGNCELMSVQGTKLRSFARAVAPRTDCFLKSLCLKILCVFGSVQSSCCLPWRAEQLVCVLFLVVLRRVSVLLSCVLLSCLPASRFPSCCVQPAALERV